MRLPYPTVSQRKPFLYIDVKNGNLKQYAGLTGTTQLMVYRVRRRGGQVNYPFNPPSPPIYYTPLEVVRNKFTFVMDSQLFNQREGRYKAALQYNGVWLADMEFIFEKPRIELDHQEDRGYV